MAQLVLLLTGGLILSFGSLSLLLPTDVQVKRVGSVFLIGISIIAVAFGYGAI